MTWWMYALVTAMIWGVHYVLLGRILAVVSPITMYVLPAIPLLFFIPLYYRTVSSDIASIMQSSNEIKISVIITMITSAAASMALFKAIQGSNATYASLIEVTYPVFVVLAGWVIFQENHLTWPVGIGGLLILSGAGIIIYSNG